MSRWLRLLVGAALSLIVLSVFALGVRYVYDRYAQPAESGLLDVLEYLFRPREEPKAPTPAPTMRGELSEAEISSCAEGKAPADYFSTIPPSSELDSIIRAYNYSLTLCAMGELPLSRPGGGLVRVRFVFGPPAFPPAPARVVRVEHSQVGNRIVAIALSNPFGMPRPIGVVERIERQLSQQAWDDIDRLLSGTSFWDLPSFDHAGGEDGAWWMLEVAEPARYHMVHRWMGGPIRPLGEHLLEISGLGSSRR